MMKQIIACIAIAVVFGTLGYTIGNLNQSKMLGGYNPKNPSYTGVYFTTTTAMKSGYAGAVRIDQYGRLIISPSSTINIIGE